jgi:hypothetical protein
MNLVAVGVFALAQLVAGGANAAVQTLTGTDVKFEYDDALMGLFGMPSVSGNTLYFTPTGFDALSVGGMGGGFDFTNQTINVKVTVLNPMKYIDDVRLNEQGDYLLLGSGAAVYVGGQIRVFDVANPIASMTDSIMPTSSMSTTGFPTRNWSAGAMVDAASFMAKTVNVTIENILVATSVPGSLGFVEKKFAALTVTAVPEPETYAMMLVGLGLIGLMAKRRRCA